MACSFLFFQWICLALVIKIMLDFLVSYLPDSLLSCILALVYVQLRKQFPSLAFYCCWVRLLVCFLVLERYSIYCVALVSQKRQGYRLCPAVMQGYVLLPVLWISKVTLWDLGLGAEISRNIGYQDLSDSCYEHHFHFSVSSWSLQWSLWCTKWVSQKAILEKLGVHPGLSFTHWRIVRPELGLLALGRSNVVKVKPLFLMRFFLVFVVLEGASASPLVSGFFTDLSCLWIFANWSSMKKTETGNDLFLHLLMPCYLLASRLVDCTCLCMCVLLRKGLLSWKHKLFSDNIFYKNYMFYFFIYVINHEIDFFVVGKY